MASTSVNTSATTDGTSAFQSSPSTSVHHRRQHPHGAEMSKGQEKARVEIILDSECLYLRGTGVDVEPALLSGNVVLSLTESTSIKEITLHFKGKSKLPPQLDHSSSLNAAPHTYILCSHDWSFLEGEKGHRHTLKAGRHLFPFQLELGGSLPASILTHALGGASISYKLRAHVVRSGFSHNLQTTAPVYLVRSFTSEALEYQQTLEVENTWPEKLMYSVMLPHKAWAAGDKLVALTKLSPLTKGVRVVKVLSSVHETTKLWSRNGYQESTKVVASARHDIIEGKALLDPGWTPKTPPQATTPPTRSSSSGSVSGYFGGITPLHSGRSHPTTSSSAAVSPPNTLGDVPSSISSRSSRQATFTTDEDSDSSDEEEPSTDVVTSIAFALPPSITPSQHLDPVHITHRIRWSIMIANPDGHTSELRCSLPLHILDFRLLDESRARSGATRRLVLGLEEYSDFGPEEDARRSAVTSRNIQEDDTELPSYGSHTRDRVGNMWLNESATMRVTNPLFGPNNITVLPGANEVLPRRLDPLNIPPIPSPGGFATTSPLEWVNTELLLSLSTSQTTIPGTAPTSTHTSSPSGSNPTSRRNSGRQSRTASQSQSRAPSPTGVSGLSSITPPSSATVGTSLPHTPGEPNPTATYVHETGTSSRPPPRLLQTSMKPFTSIASSASGWLLPSVRLHSSGDPHMSGADQQRAALTRVAQRQEVAALSAPSTPGVSGLSMRQVDPATSAELLHRAYTEVPDYGIASRGFIGGVPPLESMRGLPSYDEAAQDHNRLIDSP